MPLFTPLMPCRHADAMMMLTPLMLPPIFLPCHAALYAHIERRR